MSGHMGSNACTVQSQKIVRVDVEKNLILVAGAVPGAPGGDVKYCQLKKLRNLRNEVKYGNQCYFRGKKEKSW